MSLSRFFPNLPADATFSKMEPQRELFKFEDMSDEVIQSYRDFIQPFLTVKPGRRQFRKFLQKLSIMPLTQFSEHMGYLMAENFFRREITKQLHRLEFPTKIGTDLMVVDNTVLMENFANTGGVGVVLDRILRKFPRRDEFYTQVEFPTVFLKTTGDRELLTQLIVYLDTYMSAKDRQLYREISQKLIGYHEMEPFDSPIVLVLSAQLSAIFDKYGIKTIQSNLNYGPDLDFGIEFDTGDNDFVLMAQCNDYIDRFVKLEEMLFGRDVQPFNVHFFKGDIVVEPNRESGSLDCVKLLQQFQQFLSEQQP